MKLGLGTAQFGMDYGISNRNGITTPSQITDILNLAHANGISYLDTAAGYGKSEEVLGNVLKPHHQFRMVTKTKGIGKSALTRFDVSEVITGFQASLKKLNQQKIYGLLVHSSKDLFVEGGELLWSALSDLKRQGLVNKIGLSVYNATEIDQALGLPGFDLIQVPLSILDQRLIKSGHLKKLKEKGVEVHVRSVFLQGILLMHPEELPKGFESVKPHLKHVHDEVSKQNLSMLKAALGFAINLNEVDAVIAGVCSEDEFSQLIEAARLAPDFRGRLENLCTEFSWDDEKILNPSLWEK